MNEKTGFATANVVLAIEIIGLKNLAKNCGVTYQAVQKWRKNGLPRTEWTGETNYCDVIEELTGNRITRRMLLKNMHLNNRAVLNSSKGVNQNVNA